MMEVKEKRMDGGGGVAPSEGRGSKESLLAEAGGGSVIGGRSRKAGTVGFASSSPLVTTRSGTMIAGMGSALERERERERMLQRREKRGTLMLYQELSKGGNHQTLSLLQTATPKSQKPTTQTSSSSSSSASAQFLSTPSKSPRAAGGKSGKGDLSPRSKQQEKSPRGSTIKRVLKLTQSLTGDRGSSAHAAEEKAAASAAAADKSHGDPAQGLDSSGSNTQWRHSVAFFSQMGTGFEKMVEEQRSNENKGCVQKANLSPRYRNPEDLERRYKKVAREEEETLELRRARDRVRAKLRAKLVDKLAKRAELRATDKRNGERDEVEEWEKGDRLSNSDDLDAGSDSDDDDDDDEDDDGSKDGLALVTEDTAELELYSNLRRGMEQQQQALTQSDSAILPTIEITGAAVPRSGSQEHAVWVKQMHVDGGQAEAQGHDERVLPPGALANRGRSGTMDFYHLMNQGAKLIVPTPEDEENNEARSPEKNEGEGAESESESDENENDKRWARRRWDDGSEARLELVRDVIRLKSEDKVVDRVDIFGSQVALPVEAVALILALSCASPKDVGFLHLVSPSWANLLGQAAGDAVWALWYKQHFGGGPFITCNPREYPLSWRATYKREWASLKSRQRAESRTDDPALNMLLHFIYRGHVVLVRVVLIDRLSNQELLSGHPEPADLVNRVTATTPLHAACQVGSLPIVKELIAYGAKTNVKIGPEVVRLTPFYLACMHGHHAIVEYFLERKADQKSQARINANAGFATPVLLAAMNGHCAVLRSLLRHGGDPNQANANGELPLFVVLRRCGHLPPKTVREASGEGVLERERRRRRNVAMLRHLLTYGADAAAARTKTGESTTDVAIQAACGDYVLGLLRKHGAPAASPAPAAPAK